MLRAGPRAGGAEAADTRVSTTTSKVKSFQFAFSKFQTTVPDYTILGLFVPSCLSLGQSLATAGKHRALCLSANLVWNIVTP